MRKALATLVVLMLAIVSFGSPSEAAKPSVPAGIVNLSFDDGVDPVMTPYLLSILKSRGVKATFFVTGENVQKYPGILKRIKREGHQIGNHSWNHPDMSQLDYESAKKQIVDTNTIIEKTVGEKPILFRYPFGYWGEPSNQAIRDLGMWEVYWSNKSMTFERRNGEAFIGDWECDNSQKDLVNYVLGNAVDQASILLHDAGIESQRKRGCPVKHMDYVGTSIDKLRKQGYTFGVIETAMAPNYVNMGSWVKIVPAK